MSDAAPFLDFPARFYLEKYYSSVGVENQAFMRSVARSVRTTKHLGTVFELGGGPSLCGLLAMTAATESGPDRVVWIDVAPSSLGEVEAWLQQSAGAFRYAEVFRWVEREFGILSGELAERLRAAEWQLRHLDLRYPLPPALCGMGDVVGSHFLAEAATENEREFVEITNRAAQASSDGALVSLSYIRCSQPYRLDDGIVYPAFAVDEASLPPLLARAGLNLAEMRIERGPLEDPPARPGYDGMVFVTGEQCRSAKTGVFCTALHKCPGDSLSAP